MVLFGYVMLLFECQHKIITGGAVLTIDEYVRQQRKREKREKRKQIIKSVLKYLTEHLLEIAAVVISLLTYLTLISKE